MGRATRVLTHRKERKLANEWLEMKQEPLVPEVVLLQRCAHRFCLCSPRSMRAALQRGVRMRAPVTGHRDGDLVGETSLAEEAPPLVS